MIILHIVTLRQRIQSLVTLYPDLFVTEHSCLRLSYCTTDTRLYIFFFIKRNELFFLPANFSWTLWTGLEINPRLSKRTSLLDKEIRTLVSKVFCRGGQSWKGGRCELGCLCVWQWRYRGTLYRCTLYRKVETYTPRNETVWPCSNFYIHVSVSDFIYSHDLGRPIGGIYKSFTDTWMWKLGDRAL